MLPECVEVFERRYIGIEVTRAAHRAIAFGAEGIGSGHAECARAPIRIGFPICLARLCGGIGAEPVGVAAADHLQLAVLVYPEDSRNALGVVVGTGNGFRKARISDDGGREFPPADHLIHHSAGSGQKFLSAAHRHGIDRCAGDVMLHVVPGRTVVCSAVVVVLECAAVATHVQRIVAQAVGHSLAIGVVDREFEAMVDALAQDRLHGVVVHHGARLGDEQGTRADANRRCGAGRIHAVDADVLVVVERGRGWIGVIQRSVDVAVVLNMLALLAHIAHLQRSGAGERVLYRQIPFLHVRRLDILRIDAEVGRAAVGGCAAGKAFFRGTGRGNVTGRGRVYLDVDGLDEGRDSSETLVVGVAFKEAVGTVAAADHGAIVDLIRESEVRHPLLVIGHIARGSRADSGLRRRSHGNAAGIHDLSGGEIDRSSLVILFDPGLVEFVAEAEIQGQVRHDLEIVADVTSGAPLALSHVDAAQRDAN